MTVLSALPAKLWSTVAVLVGTVAAVAAILLVPVPDNLDRRSASGLGSDYQSVQVQRALDDLPSSQVDPVLVVLSRQDGAELGPADLEAATALIEELADFAVGGDVSPPQPSPDGTVALVVVPLPAGLDPDTEVPGAVADIRDAAAGLPPELRVEVTGGPAFTADIEAVFDGASVRLLIASAVVVVVLLGLTYRSPLLVVVPLVVVVAIEQAVVRLLELVLPAAGLAYDGQTTGLVSVLVFGAATNYALLLISRYREELRSTADARRAMATAVQRAGGAILASGGTVILAVLTLLLSRTEGNQAIGLGAAMGVACALLGGLVVLPCALVIFGRAAFWPLVPRQGSTGREGRLWGRLGEASSRRPALVVLVGLAGLLALAAPAIGIQTGLSQNEQFINEPEAVTGAKTLASAFPAGAVSPTTVISPADRADAVADAAGDVDGVVSAAAGESAQGITRVDVVLDAEPGSQRSEDVVRTLREAVAEAGGPDAAVGGEAAQAVDVADASSDDRLLIVPLILVLVTLVLVALLRAVVASLLLLVAVVATYFSSLGMSWLVFRYVFDFPAVDPAVVLFSFVFLVALGVDYSIFLTSRAREEAAREGTPAGMITAIRATGGVITSAGVLLAAVFAVLGVLPLLALAQVGVIVGLGVLLDTLVVRTVIVPAFAFLLKEKFWWPSRVDPPAVGGLADLRT